MSISSGSLATSHAAPSPNACGNGLVRASSRQMHTALRVAQDTEVQILSTTSVRTSKEKKAMDQRPGMLVEA